MSKTKFIKSSDGASLIEYGILAGLVSVVSIAAISGTGQQIFGIYSHAEATLADKSGNPGGGGPGEPEVVVDPYVDDVDPNTWLILTDASDVATLDGHVGVYGKDDNDDITGTPAVEIFIGGRGDDVMRSGGGNDTFIYSLGDGSDTIDVYRRYASANETLEMRDIASTDVTMSQTAYNGDAVITLPDGAAVSIFHQMAARESRKIENIQFSDVTFNDQMLRDRIVSDMKAEGVTLSGTGLGENYFHYAGDPSYTISDYYDYIISHTDTLSFDDHAPDEAKFINDGTDLKINLGGSSVTLSRQDRQDTNYFIEQINMKGGVTMNHQAIRDKANEDAKASGIVKGFHHNDNFYHTAATDRDYKITDFSYISNDQDNLIFTDQNSTDVTVYQVGNDAVIYTAGDATAVTVENQLSNAQYEIENFVFQDVTWTAADLAAVVSPNAPPARPPAGGDGDGGGGGAGPVWCAPAGWTWNHTNDTYTVPGLSFFAKENPPAQRSATLGPGAESTIQIPNPDALDVYGEYSHKHQTYSWHYWNYTNSIPAGTTTRPDPSCG